MSNPKILQVPFYLQVENISKAFPNPTEDQIISLPMKDPDNPDIVYYSIPPYPDGTIDVNGYDIINFTLTNADGVDGNCFWLTSFDTNTNGPIIDGPTPNPIGTVVNHPPNEMALSLLPDKSGGPETQTFTLHCYFVFYNKFKNKNVVYHCSLDPKLKVSQPPAPNE